MSIKDSFTRASGVVSDVEHRTYDLLSKGAVSLDLLQPSGVGLGTAFSGSDLAHKEKYQLFRGWLYSAVNALASEAAGQAVVVGKYSNETKDKRGVPTKKLRVVKNAPSNVMLKAADAKLEILLNHPIQKMVERPNTIQHRWQLIYSFVANLNLTGWGYIVAGWTEDNQFEMYSVPTTWVKPNHEKGPFTRFKIVDPQTAYKDDSDDDWLTTENVKFAYIPNPADPRLAYAPASSQRNAARIDEFIQSSQQVFFDNGIFPSVIVSIGKDPHPDVPGGIRPRLTGAQRRQVTAAIRKTMSGVANYGNPAIIDGLIESITKFSSSSEEMGWDKSEQAVKTRILSAFCVHPYILGETVSVGGYAQAAKIEERFCKRVNTNLDMLSTILTDFAPLMTKNEDSGLEVWVEQCVPHDPSLKWSNLNAARNRGDVTKNEVRAELNLPPDEDGGDISKVFTAGDINSLMQVLGHLSGGNISKEQALSILTICYDLSEEDANQLIKNHPVKPQQPQQPGGQPPKPGAPQPTGEEEVVKEMRKAIEIMSRFDDTAVIDAKASEKVKSILQSL